jgi:hypothetical protein
MGRPFAKGVSGNPAGRPKDTRNRLTKKVLEDILQHWNELEPRGTKGETKGLFALERAYKDKPVEYLRAVLSVMPKELAIESVMADMSDADLDELTVAIKNHLTAKREKPKDEDAEPSVH